MEKGLITTQILTDIAEALRDKYGIDNEIKPIEMPDYIRDLETKEKNYRYYSAYKGLITPIDGAYVQGFYNNGVAIGDKIYFPRNDTTKAHWNPEEYPVLTTFYCYDTTTNTLTSKIPLYEGERFHINGMWYDGTAIYGFGLPYRYKTTDFGETWTREEMTSVGTYQPTPIYRLRSGRLIGTVLNRESFLMISDDNGLTWTTLSPFTSEQFDGALYTMSHGTICELDDSIALYFNTPIALYGAGVQNNDSQRYVSVSYDDGNTWSAPKKCSDDLGIAGYGISPGGFGYLGNKYHYVVGLRYKWKSYDSKLNVVGELKWYTGSADDVKNGTMELRKVLDHTLVPKKTDDAAMSSEDTGNGGVCLCNGKLYCNYGNIIYNHDDNERQYISNQGIEMYCISLSKEKDEEPYWDANFKAKFDALMEEKSTAYEYYFYSPTETNLKYSWFGYANRGYIPNVGKFAIPLGNGDYEINVVYGSGLQISTSAPKICAGLEVVSDNSLHAFGAVTADGGERSFDHTNSRRKSASLPARDDGGYLTFKKQNGKLTIAVNGVTLTNPKFDWTMGKSSVWQEATTDTYVYNANATDEEVAEYIASAPRDFNMGGLKLLTIKCAQANKKVYITQTDDALDIKSSGEGSSTTVLVTRKNANLRIE